MMPDFDAFHIRDRVPGSGRARDRHAEITGAGDFLGTGDGRGKQGCDHDTSGDDPRDTAHV